MRYVQVVSGELVEFASSMDEAREIAEEMERDGRKDVVIEEVK